MGSPHSHRVLVVDDDAACLEALVFFLRQAGFVVDGAPGGVEALNRLRSKGQPCAVVTDALMPDMNGWELVAAMQAEPHLAGVPIVMMSGRSDEVARALAEGVRAYLPKPTDPQEIADTVARYCRCAKA